MDVYFRTVTEGDVGRITHRGSITAVVTHPEKHPEKAKLLREHVPDEDTYREHNDSPGTLYLVTDIITLENQFSQTELKKRDGSPVDENYRRGYAIVQRHSKY